MNEHREVTEAKSQSEKNTHTMTPFIDVQRQEKLKRILLRDNICGKAILKMQERDGHTMRTEE